VNRDDILTRSGRAGVRYLAARWPDLPLPRLAEEVHQHLGSPEDMSLADLRAVLTGRSLRDPSRVIERVPLEAIQAVGGIVRRGGSLSAAARATGLSLDTVRAIDEASGLRHIRRAHVLAAVRQARARGASVRGTADAVGLPRATAHRIIREVES
jgi:hypothetical protein